MCGYWNAADYWNKRRSLRAVQIGKDKQVWKSACSAALSQEVALHRKQKQVPIQVYACWDKWMHSPELALPPTSAHAPGCVTELELGGGVEWPPEGTWMLQGAVIMGLRRRSDWGIYSLDIANRNSNSASDLASCIATEMRSSISRLYVAIGEGTPGTCRGVRKCEAFCWAWPNTHGSGLQIPRGIGVFSRSPPLPCSPRQLRKEHLSGSPSRSLVWPSSPPPKNNGKQRELPLEWWKPWGNSKKGVAVQRGSCHWSLSFLSQRACVWWEVEDTNAGISGRKIGFING